MGCKKPPLAPRAWEHRAATNRIPFPPPISSCDILRQQGTKDRGAQSSVHVAGRKSSHLLPHSSLPSSSQVGTQL